MKKNIPNKKIGMHYDVEKQKFIISFDFDATKEEFLQAWDTFSEARTKVTGRKHYKRLKPPKDLVLLYGVDFLMKTNLTFKDIHEAYDNNQIPYFNGEYPFLTEFDLQKYYNRNKKHLKTKK